MMLPKIVYFVPVRSVSVGITFDDGPTPGVTERLLDALAAKRAKATFFMVGDAVRKNPGLAKEVSDAGHAVGIHSDHHRRGMKEWSAAEVLDDFARCKDSLSQAIGKEVSLVRPPFGNVCPSIMDACVQLDLTYVGWNVNSKDWLGWSSNRLASCSRGSIILFHDGGRVNKDNANGTISLVESLLGDFRGLSSVTVPDLIGFWADSRVVKEENGLRLLGWNALCDATGGTLYVYWHPDDLVTGMSYAFDFMGRRMSVAVPPMSNVDDWVKPVKATACKNADGGTILGKMRSSRYNEGVKETKVNLGCGDHILDGWDNFDTDSRATPPVRAWEWNRALPYADGSVGAVLVQHSLQHCRPEDYDRNFLEIRRILKPGGKFVLKEADDRHYVWHKPGSKDRDGNIASSISEPVAVKVLSRNGFLTSTDRANIVARWGETINRQRRIVNGHNLFVVEGTKPEE